MLRDHHRHHANEPLSVTMAEKVRDIFRDLALSVILDTSQMIEGVNSMPDLLLGDHDQAENVLVEASLAEYKQGMAFFHAVSHRVER